MSLSDRLGVSVTASRVKIRPAAWLLQLAVCCQVYRYNTVPLGIGRRGGFEAPDEIQDTAAI